MLHIWIFPSLRFCVKSIFEILKVLKIPYFVISEALNFDFWSISAVTKCKLSYESKFRASKCVNIADFALLETTKLISHKIWATEKSWNFHSVLYPKCYTPQTLFFQRVRQDCLCIVKSKNYERDWRWIIPIRFYGCLTS